MDGARKTENFLIWPKLHFVPWSGMARPIHHKREVIVHYSIGSNFHKIYQEANKDYHYDKNIFGSLSALYIIIAVDVFVVTFAK